MAKRSLTEIVGYARGAWPRRGIRRLGPVNVRGKVVRRGGVGSVRVGRGATLWPAVVFDFEAASPGSTPSIEIGEWSSVGDRTEIHCASLVHIGRHVRISWDCVLLESDYHTADGSPAAPSPIVIEDGAWIGCRVIILKGVTVGTGAVVGAGSVVTKDVAAHTVVAGNPARRISSTEREVT